MLQGKDSNLLEYDVAVVTEKSFPEVTLERLLDGLEDPAAAAAVKVGRLGHVAAENVARVDDAGGERVVDAVVVVDGLKGSQTQLRLQEFQLLFSAWGHVTLNQGHLSVEDEEKSKKFRRCGKASRVIH